MKKNIIALLVTCWMITDPNERATCIAQQRRSSGPCSFIADSAARARCQARGSANPRECDTITNAWKRDECRRQARR